MGKIAPGAGPLVTEQGDVLARRNNVVGQHKMHNKATEPTYNDQIFGRPAVGVRPQDGEKMGRVHDVSRHRIHKVMAHMYASQRARTQPPASPN